MTDQDLLRQYTEEGSEEAFTTLVGRHLNLVYWSARRQVRSDEMAREITQVVFLDLSFNSRKLRPDTHLASWLYVVTRRTAVDAIRRETRRQKREQVAVETAAINSSSTIWTTVEPLLDEAVASLDETDRKAVLLRYFESKNLRAIGDALGVSEDAAQKRVSRGVERLRDFFLKRGVTASVAGIVADISVNAIQAAPAGLGAAVSSAVALSRAAIPQAVIFHAAKTLTMTTTQKAIAAAMLAAAIGGGIYQQNLIRRQEKRIASFEQQTMSWDEQMRAWRTQRAVVSEHSAAVSSSEAARTSKFGSAINPRARLQILEDLQKRKLLNSNMTFINRDGALGSAFVELFFLTPEEQAALQKAVDGARQQIGNLMAANATVHNNGANNIVINVKPFEGGLAVEDNVMSAFANTLGPDRFSSFLALGSNQVQQSLGNFGAEEETISITNNSSAPNQGDAPYVVVDTRTTANTGGNNTLTHKYGFPSLGDVSARWPVTQLLPKNF